MKHIFTLILMVYVAQFSNAAAGPEKEEAYIDDIKPVHSTIKKMGAINFGHEKEDSPIPIRDFARLRYMLEVDFDDARPMERIGRCALSVLKGFNTDPFYEYSRVDRDNTGQMHHDLVATLVLYHLPEEADPARKWLARRHIMGWLSAPVNSVYKHPVRKLIIVKQRKCCWCFPSNS